MNVGSKVTTLGTFLHDVQTVRALIDCRRELTEESARQWLALLVLPENAPRVGTVYQHRFREMLERATSLSGKEKRTVANKIWEARDLLFARKGEDTYASEARLEFAGEPQRPALKRTRETPSSDGGREGDARDTESSDGEEEDSEVVDQPDPTTEEEQESPQESLLIEKIGQCVPYHPSRVQRINNACYRVDFREGHFAIVSSKQGLRLFPRGSDPRTDSGAFYPAWTDLLGDQEREILFPHTSHAKKRQKSGGEEYPEIFEDSTAAKLFHSQYGKDNVKVVDTHTGVGYEWDTQKKLWVSKTRAQLRYSVNSFFDNWCSSNNIEDARVNQHAKSMPFCTRVCGFVAILCYDPDFEERIDSDRNTLPIRGGSVVDLRTGDVTPRTREHFFSVELDVDVLPETDSLPHVQAWASDVFGEQVVPFMQKVSGYFCTGRMDCAKIFVLWGEGRNGKSTYCKLLEKILDHFYTPVAKEVFVQLDRTRAEGAPSAHLASLSKKRIAVFTELKDGDKLNDGLLKAFSGNDSIRYRSPYSVREKTLTPMFKPVICTNNKPEFDVNDQAMVDRYILVPFLNRFVDNPREGEKKKDEALIASLFGEYRDEVFTWFVRGAVEWYNTPHFEWMPESVQQATREHIEEIDPIGKFLSEEVEQTEDDNDKALCRDLYQMYQSWNQRLPYPVPKVTAQKFCSRLKKEFPFYAPQNKVTFRRMKLRPKYVGPNMAF